MIKLRFLIFLFCILHKCEMRQMRKKINEKQEISKICLTSECKNAASTIQSSIDPKVAPCDDFYKFACGNFLKTTVVPKYETKIDRYDFLNSKIQDQLKTIIEEPIQRNEPRFITLSKNYYKACMNTTATEKNGVNTLLGKLKKIGGWPLLEGNLWKEKNFDWKQATYEMQKLGFETYYLFDFNVATDFLNSTKNVLNIDQCYLIDKLESGANTLNDEYNKEKYKYMIDVAVKLGANKARAGKECKETLDFEMQLSSMTLTDEERSNQTALNNLMTVKELTEKHPSIPWKEYFNKMLHPVLVIDDDEIIKVSAPTFFEKFEKLIKKTPKRVVANYLCWKAVEDSLDFLPDKILNLQINFSSGFSEPIEREDSARWEGCLGMTNNNVLMASVGALYVRKYFTQESKKIAKEIAVDIKQQLKKDIKKVDWMDETTRASALDKLESLKMFIGHPDEILDDKILDEYYKTLEIIPDNYIQTQLNLNIFMKNRAFSQLRKRADKSDWPWLIHSYTTRTYSYYDEHLNTIENPAGLLQDIFFNKNRPQYLNYAAFGSFIFGNEITKAFDNDGRKFDKNGYHKDWWTPQTNTKFHQKAGCIIQQYGNYTVKDSGVKMNGNQTKDINIADNEGLKISYLAYQDWVKRHDTEPKLPGLKYSQSQLFWIQAAITQCAKYAPEDEKNSTPDDEPANPMNFPLEFRVTGAFSNRPEFASDFNCPVGSKMNPVKKCSVW